MAPPLIAIRDIVVSWGGRPFIEGAEAAVGAGDRLCLVGRNGCGKSTLLKIMAGLIEPDGGAVFVQPGCQVAYLPQEPDLSGFATAADFIAAGLPHHSTEARHEVDIWLETLGLDGGRPTAAMSGGERRRAALARTLIGNPDVLLLDEPTNHLDLKAIAWLEDWLQGFSGAYVVISHDRTFLEKLTRATFWLDRGRVRRLEAGYHAFEDWADGILVREEEERRKLDKLIAEETRWSHQGITARRKRNEGRLRRLRDLRLERARQISRAGSVRLEAETGAQSGRLVVEADGIGKAFGERVILRDFSTRILRGDKVGIIGPNGAGKSTLLRLLTGEIGPDGGRIRLGTNLSPVFLDQTRSTLDPAKSLWDTLCERGGDQVFVQGRPRHVVAYLRDFLFDERQARSPVGSLSGGERNRLLLARTLAQPTNFLILDEPTNDLDMDTLDLLQEMLSDYEGTLLLVSHDRDFLDRVVTSTIVLEGDGRAIEYAGGYTDYLAQRGDAAAGGAPVAKGGARPRAAGMPARPADRRPAKLTFGQQRALTDLPRRIAALEAEIAKLHARLAEPDLYARQPGEFARAADRLTAAQGELAAAEEEWLDLEMLREELETTRPG